MRKTVIKLDKDQITYAQQKEFDYEMQAYVKKYLLVHREKAYWIIWDQCSEPLQNKIKIYTKWDNISSIQKLYRLS